MVFPEKILLQMNWNVIYAFTVMPSTVIYLSSTFLIVLSSVPPPPPSFPPGPPPPFSLAENFRPTPIE